MDGAVSVAQMPAAGGYGLTRSYRRRPDVEAEIVALPADPSSLLRALRNAKAYETLVHGIRRLCADGRNHDAEVVADRLIDRATPLIARVAKSISVSADEREDVIQEATIRMWKEVGDASPQHEFWEVHFERMVRLACKDAADPLYRARKHERPFMRGTSTEGDTWDEEETLADPQALEPALLVPEALAQLGGNERRAMYLKTLGYKERSKDSAEPTISSILRVSDRTVRNYLRAGEAALRDWLDDERSESER